MPAIRFAFRDASMLEHPGRGRRFHAQVAPDAWVAACRAGHEWGSRTSTMLDSHTSNTADRVPEVVICKRPACYRKWREARGWSA